MVLEIPIPLAFIEILAKNVHAAIDVGVDKTSVRRTVQATLDTFATELRCSFNPVFRQGIHIKAGCLARVAFLLGNIFNSMKIFIRKRKELSFVLIPFLLFLFFLFNNTCNCFKFVLILHYSILQLFICFSKFLYTCLKSFNTLLITSFLFIASTLASVV